MPLPFAYVAAPPFDRPFDTSARKLQRPSRWTAAAPLRCGGRCTAVLRSRAPLLTCARRAPWGCSGRAGLRGGSTAAAARAGAHALAATPPRKACKRCARFDAVRSCCRAAGCWHRGRRPGARGTAARRCAAVPVARCASLVGSASLGAATARQDPRARWPAGTPAQRHVSGAAAWSLCSRTAAAQPLTGAACCAAAATVVGLRSACLLSARCNAELVGHAAAACGSAYQPPRTAFKAGCCSPLGQLCCSVARLPPRPSRLAGAASCWNGGHDQTHRLCSF